MSEEKSSLSKPGRKPHDATPERRELVAAMARDGRTQFEIAEWLEIDRLTLRRYYYEELCEADEEMTAKVKDSLFKNATEHNNVTAQIFWMKVRAGWSEKIKLEHSGEIATGSIDLTKLTDEQLAQLRTIAVSAIGND